MPTGLDTIIFAIPGQAPGISQTAVLEYPSSRPVIIEHDQATP
jgi:hypothetical protein